MSVDALLQLMQAASARRLQKQMHDESLAQAQQQFEQNQQRLAEDLEFRRQAQASSLAESLRSSRLQQQHLDQARQFQLWNMEAGGQIERNPIAGQQLPGMVGVNAPDADITEGGVGYSFVPAETRAAKLVEAQKRAAYETQQAANESLVTTARKYKDDPVALEALFGRTRPARTRGDIVSDYGKALMESYQLSQSIPHVMSNFGPGSPEAQQLNRQLRESHTKVNSFRDEARLWDSMNPDTPNAGVGAGVTLDKWNNEKSIESHSSALMLRLEPKLTKLVLNDPAKLNSLVVKEAEDYARALVATGGQGAAAEFTKNYRAVMDNLVKTLRARNSGGSGLSFSESIQQAFGVVSPQPQAK